MVAGLAFVATAVATAVRRRRRSCATPGTGRPTSGAWTIALALFALASAALATGASTGWDSGTFRVFYLLGAVLNVPWLALGTVYLLGGRTRRPTGSAPVLVLFTGLAARRDARARRCTARSPATARSRWARTCSACSRACSPASAAGVGARRGVGGAVVVGGPVRAAAPGPASAGSRPRNVLIALGTLVLSSGGLAAGRRRPGRGVRAHARVGIAVIYVGFLRRVTSPAAARPRDVPSPTDGASTTSVSGGPDPSARRRGRGAGACRRSRGQLVDELDRVGSL